MAWQSSSINAATTTPAADIGKITNDLQQLRSVIGGTPDAAIPSVWTTIAALVAQSLNSGTTGGTSTAYTLTPAGAITAYAANQSFWVTFHTTSGASPTLQISGVASPPALVRYNSAGAVVAIGAGELPSGYATRVTLLSATQALVEEMPPSAASSATPQVRQTVLNGPVDANGLPNFGGSTGSTTVTASGTLTATASSNAADRIGTITNPSWTGLSTNGTMYLYLDIASNGVCTPGSTTLAPTYRWGGADVVTSGQNTFNIQEMQMKVGNGSTASQVWRVFVGRVTVAGGVVTAITWYGLMGRYDSGYTSSIPGASTTVTKNHNLGVEPNQKTIEIKNLITEQGWAVGECGTPVTNGGALSPFGLSTTDLVISFITGNTNSFYLQNKSTGTFQPLTSANWAYRLTASRGW